MSSRTPLVLNLLLIPIAEFLSLLLDGNVLSGMLLFTLLAFVANAFMCAKSLWNRRYPLTLIYLAIALIEIPLCIVLSTPARIGH